VSDKYEKTQIVIGEEEHRKPANSSQLFEEVRAFQKRVEDESCIEPPAVELDLATYSNSAA